ncbi:beta-aspartyl-peptidase (threonine type) [Saccharopolyspora shandongensis]|uniref:Beta-aspartyl-peptidase (Threonine type) n=1 Tax=Saccharopolyspora shandongensis TaxID=418495 RepID=A0A1H3U480_9PSEU|nr:isoaspartyl peptidase/L-asparaginase [Saccharopolyspora shandongensis]SDZ56891.1 beta-aspartyl-peptidase (threonine type) [Saccharopolyspora shandongensis]
MRRRVWTVVSSVLAVPVLVLGAVSASTGWAESGAAADDVSLAVHCGTDALDRTTTPPEVGAEYERMFQEALRAGYAVLHRNGSAVDAVQAAVVVLEDNPLCNAGRGAVFNENAEHQLDSAIMDGRTLDVGAVAAVENVKNPVKAARLVMDQTPHVLLVGEGADDFAAAKGLETATQDYYWTQRRWDSLMAAKRDAASIKAEEHGTVGAVAVDRRGQLAAATSTGGLTNKMVGRVGDSPIAGAGTYADSKFVAVSGTGKGEAFIRANAAREVAVQMEHRGLDVAAAAQAAIDRVVRVEGDGGLIALDPRGEFAAPSTDSVKYAWITKSGDVQTRFYRN